MIIRKALYALTLIAYSLSLAHSVIPHHHHKTSDEASLHHEGHDHHNSDHDHHDHEKNEHEDKSDSGHFFFFSHDINADVLIKHGSINNSVKIKTVFASVPVKEQIPATSKSCYIVFHPPPDDQISQSVSIPSNKLRGPPTLT
jgi:hypothetical protein